MNQPDSTLSSVGLQGSPAVNGADVHVSTDQSGAVRKLTLLAGSVTLVVALGGLSAVMAQPSTGVTAGNFMAATLPAPVLDTLVDTSPSNTTPVTPGTSSDTSNTTESSGSATNSSTSTVTVNGQNISVPSNGTVTKTVTNGAGNTSVTITSTNSGSSSNSSSSVSVNSFSSSYSGGSHVTFNNVTGQ